MKKASASKHVSLAFHNRVLPADVYLESKDRIWGDILKHEKVLNDIWKDLWAECIVPKEMRPKDYPLNKNKSQKLTGISSSSFYSPKPSVAAPIKSSGVIGWRSQIPENAFNYFNIKYDPPKKRFVNEQYGFYRFLKYLQDSKTRVKTETKDEQQRLPRKSIRHSIKPFIC